MMDMSLLSFSDDLNLEDKKLRLKRIHEINHLQVCRLDTIQIHSHGARSEDQQPAHVKQTESNKTICHGVRYSRHKEAVTSYLHESSVEDIYERKYDTSQESLTCEEQLPVERLRAKALDQISIAPAVSNEPARVISYHPPSKYVKQSTKKVYSPSDISTQTSRTLIELLQEESGNDHSSLQSRCSVMKRSSSIMSMRSNDSDQEDEKNPWQMHQTYMNGSINSKMSSASKMRRPRQLVSPSYTRNRTGTPHKLIVTPRKIGIRQTPKNHININSDMLNRSLRQSAIPVRCDGVYGSASNSSSINSERITLASVIDKIYNFSWEVILGGMNELLYIAGHVNWTQHEREICLIFRKLLECFRSPRSSVGRVACQVSGEMFRITKCSRRPEYDELVEVLLNKTADTNRFIQRDSNVALDKMVSSIPMFHVVRAICNRGPQHKNPLVRSTVARLLICTCALNGNDSILGINANANTRRRVLTSLSKFLLDKSQETRKFGERLCNILQKHRYFQEYFFKDMEPNTKFALKKIIKGVNYKVF